MEMLSSTRSQPDIYFVIFSIHLFPPFSFLVSSLSSSLFVCLKIKPKSLSAAFSPVTITNAFFGYKYRYIFVEQVSENWSYLLLVTCRCRAVEAGCFKCPTRCTDRAGSWMCSQSQPWRLTPVACSNVWPPVGWRSFFSIPVCFFWCRVSARPLVL